MNHHCKTGYHVEPARGCYTTHACRCDGCREANTARRLVAKPDDVDVDPADPADASDVATLAYRDPVADDAACARSDPDLFFPSDGEHHSDAALRVCLDVCAAANGPGFLAACHRRWVDLGGLLGIGDAGGGVVAGTTPNQRKAVRNGRTSLGRVWAVNRSRLGVDTPHPRT